MYGNAVSPSHIISHTSKDGTSIASHMKNANRSDSKKETQRLCMSLAGILHDMLLVQSEFALKVDGCWLVFGTLFLVLPCVNAFLILRI